MTYEYFVIICFELVIQLLNIDWEYFFAIYPSRLMKISILYFMWTLYCNQFSFHVYFRSNGLQLKFLICLNMKSWFNYSRWAQTSLCWIIIVEAFECNFSWFAIISYTGIYKHVKSFHAWRRACSSIKYRNSQHQYRNSQCGDMIISRKIISLA